MKKIISILLCVMMLLSSAMLLSSCALLDVLPEGLRDIIVSIFGLDDNNGPDDPDDPDDPEDPVTHSVTISYGNGDLDTEILSLTEGSLIPEPDTPVRPGYTFLGFFDGERKWDFATDKVTEDLSLVAGWELITYELVYELGGGVNSEENPESFDVTSGNITLNAPTRKGYTFSGWFADADFTESIDSIDPSVLADVTVYARWTLNVYNITYELGGGTNSPDNPPTFDIEAGEVTLGTPTKEGYLFGGWYTDVDPENKVTTVNIDLYGDITLYASWILNVYNVTYELGVNGATNQNPGSFDIETGDITLGKPEAPGYTFAGWYTDPDFKTPITVINVNIFADITIYAKWEKNIYNITYELYGGVNAEANPGEFDVESGTLELGSATRPGYSFDGWYTDPDFKNQVTHINVLGSVTLYAKWKVNVYNITYNLNGGINSKDNPTSFDVNTGIIVLGVPTRDGFAFDGWYTDSGFEDPISIIDVNVYKDITVYAKWIDVTQFFTYSVFNTNATITAYSGTLEELIIPEYIGDFKVTTIASGALSGNAYLKRLTLPDGIKLEAGACESCYALEELTVYASEIGEGAFRGCSALKKLHLVGNVSTISNSAFADAVSLTEVYYNVTAKPSLKTNNLIFSNAGRAKEGIKVVIGKDVTSVPNYLFVPSSDDVSLYPKVTSLNFEAGSVCESIGASFSHCQDLRTVWIPESVKSINTAFTYCTSLRDIYLDAAKLTSAYYTPCAFTCSGNAEEGMRVHVGKSVTVIPNHFMYDVHGDTTLYLDEVVFEEGSALTLIGDKAFYRTGIRSFVIPDSVTIVGSHAFLSCDKLEELTIGSGVSSVASLAFSGLSSLRVLNLGGSISNGGSDAFTGLVSLEELYFNATSFPNGSYDTVFKDMATKSSGLKVIIGKDVTSVPDYLLYNVKRVTSIEFEEGGVCTSIGQRAFAYTSVLTFVIPDSVTYIANYAFDGLRNLVSLTIGKGLTNLNNSSFRSTDSVLEIYNRSEIEIVAGQTTVGDASRYALNVYTDTEGESKLVYKDDGFVYYVDGEVIHLVGYRGTSDTITIPESYDGKSYSIYKHALLGFNAATSLIIGDVNASSIGYYAFSGLTELESLYFNYKGKLNTGVFDSIGTAGEGVKVVIGKDITAVPERMFSYSSNTYTVAANVVEISFEEGTQCKSIGAGSFSVASLKKVSIPECIENIDPAAFATSTSIEGNVYGNVIYIGPKSNGYLVAISAVSTDVTTAAIHKDTKIISSYLFRNCTMLTDVLVEAEELNAGVMNGASFATAGKDSGGLVLRIGKGVKYIPDYFIASSSYSPPYITSIAFEEGGICESIGYSAFSRLTYLKDIAIPDSVKKIGGSAFAYCSSLTEIVIPDSVTELGSSAFNSCSSLVEVVIGDGLITIDGMAFGYCSSLAKVTLGKSVKSIGNNAFLCFQSSSYPVNNRITEIYNKSSLELVAGSRSYGYLAEAAINIYTPTEGESKMVITPDGFVTCERDGVIYLTGYVGTATDITLPESIDGKSYVITPCAFLSTKLTSVTIPAEAGSIPSYAFAQCASLKTVRIEDGGERAIGEYAFSNCTSLDFVYIGSGVKTIGKHAFYYDSKLTAIHLSDSVTSIDSYAFSSTTRLKSVYYAGDAEAFAKIEIKNSPFSSATVYYYSESDPASSGTHWHYAEDGSIVLW